MAGGFVPSDPSDNYEDDNYDDYYNEIADDYEDVYTGGLQSVNILSPPTEPSIT